MTLETLRNELALLPVQERADLAYFLLESLDEPGAKEVELAWDAALRRRLEEIENGHGAGIPAQEVLTDF